MEFWQFEQRINLSLKAKIALSKTRIKEWYNHYDSRVYVSFSGGMDSTVLLNIVRQVYPEIPAVFFDTGMEYPEIKAHVKGTENVTIIRPKKTFSQVIKEYGYPIISKQTAHALSMHQNPTEENKASRNLHLTGYTRSGQYAPNFKLAEKWRYLKDAPFKISDRCCHWLKKEPARRYIKETGRYPMLGTQATESRIRKDVYLKTGCNAYDLKHPRSTPLGFWTNQNTLEYLKKMGIPYASIYGDIIEKRGKLETTGEGGTGCMFCMFGVHLEKHPNRFDRLKKSHPKHYDYCMKKLGLQKVLDYIGVYQYESLEIY
ncbi:class V aminotransferase [Candidatus Pacearchaeota archaeon]|nr:class V aminotransferase [Candidatus Pacearchaeota archaeon]